MLTGDAGKAKDRLAWKPSVEFEQLVEMMVDADLAAERRIPDEPYPGDVTPATRDRRNYPRSRLPLR